MAHSFDVLRGKSLAIFGAGYVGSALAAEALGLGLRVSALTRNAATAAALERSGCATVVADLADPAWHARMAPAELVVNCVSSGGGGLAGYQHSYVDGTRTIARWLGGHRQTRTFLYTSSTSVYPQTHGIVDETSPTDSATGNARVLLDAEEEVRSAALAGNCRAAVVLRLAGIYGPERHHLLDQLRSGAMSLAGRGEHLLNLIHRDDIVCAILLTLAACQLTGAVTLNVADDTPTKKADVVAWLAGRLGVPVPPFSGEPLPGRRSDPPNRAVSNVLIKQTLSWRPAYPDFRAGYEALLGA